MTTHLMAKHNSSPHTRPEDGYSIFIEWVDCPDCLRDYLKGWQKSKSERAEAVRARLRDMGEKFDEV